MKNDVCMFNNTTLTYKWRLEIGTDMQIDDSDEVHLHISGNIKLDVNDVKMVCEWWCMTWWETIWGC